MNIKVSAAPARIALAFLAIALISPFLALNYQSQVRLNDLQNSGIAINANVTNKNCRDHGQVGYAFVVDGRKFGGYGSCLLSCDSAKVGDPVAVTYFAKDPNNSECQGLLYKQQSITNNFYALLAIAGFFAVLIYRVTQASSTGEPGNVR
jgi:hypothetical protein